MASTKSFPLRYDNHWLVFGKPSSRTIIPTWKSIPKCWAFKVCPDFGTLPEALVFLTVECRCVQGYIQIKNTCTNGSLQIYTVTYEPQSLSCNNFITFALLVAVFIKDKMYDLNETNPASKCMKVTYKNHTFFQLSRLPSVLHGNDTTLYRIRTVGRKRLSGSVSGVQRQRV